MNFGISRRQFCAMGIKTLAALIAGKIIGCSNQTNVRQTQRPTSWKAAEQSLRVLAERAGIQIGAAVAPEHLGETQYAETLSQEFNLVVPENCMKWEQIHPNEGNYDWQPADAFVDFAGRHGMQARGHTLVWHEQLPSWLTKRQWGRTELTSTLEAHIKTVVGRYAGRIQYWDVANEVISDPWLGVLGCGLRDTLWRQVIGKDYLSLAFETTHETDPNAKLFINDYGAEEVNLKSDALYSLVRDLRARGVPLDGVGFQLHLELDRGLDFDSFERNLQRFIDLGVEVQFTEVDVAIAGEVNQEKLEHQAAIYHQLMKIARGYPQVTAFLTWGVTDKYSWLPWFGREIMHSSRPYGCGLLFDEQYLPKPAYFALQNALQAPVE